MGEQVQREVECGENVWVRGFFCVLKTVMKDAYDL